MPKVQTKINHDSLWIKITWPHGWGKVKITRRGESFEATSQEAMDKIESLWISTEGKKMSYGERIQAIEDEVSA